MDWHRQLNDWFLQFEHITREEVPGIVAETAVEFFKERFSTEEWDKKPWPALNPKYADSKTRGKGRILFASSNLMNSIRPHEVNSSRVVISAGNSKVPYARVHNEGLRVRGVQYVRPHRRFRSNKRVQVRGHPRKVDYQMPKRQYMGHSPYLNEIIKTRLTKAFKE